MSKEAKGTALHPRGTPPPIALAPMAPRLDTLDGKTVYLMDVRFVGGYHLLQEMQDWFARNMPKVRTVLREKKGDYMQDDPKLWAEIKEKGDAVVMAIAH
jgi:hypothetical protein